MVYGARGGGARPVAEILMVAHEFFLTTDDTFKLLTTTTHNAENGRQQ